MRNHRFLKPLAAVAVVFGALTVFSGWQGLFGNEATRTALGNTVGFVLWFNFVAGFAYVAAGLGLWKPQPWARHLATGIALSTALVAVAFAVHVATGGAYEPRTVGALALRLGFWVLLAWVARRQVD
ncbi:hypothetical protein [Hydrogenophaga sp.]|uniref:hypothetical protein n=1 Tax=Hydrogenophaga sp. TaxID=1904254 RepID=UPI003F6B5B51